LLIFFKFLKMEKNKFKTIANVVGFLKKQTIREEEYNFLLKK